MYISNAVFVVDSFSNDKTLSIAESMGAKVFQNAWPGNQAKQFNWALENLPIKTKWVLRLDADEYLYPELIREIQFKLDFLSPDITGIVFKRRHIFLEKWMKHGIYPVKLLRLFQYKKAICEQRLMDEHIQLIEGRSLEFDNDFADHNHNSLSSWTIKHNGYAIREAIDLLDVEFGIFDKTSANYQLGEQAANKRRKKFLYAKQPLFWRSFLYFVYRYFFKLGFVDGTEGFLWHFLQGWWYRTLVDAKIWEIKKACGNDRQRMIDYIKNEFKIDIDCFL